LAIVSASPSEREASSETSAAPASTALPAREREPRRRGVRPFSTLTRRILFLNLGALALLLAGILYLDQVRTGLLDARLAALSSQAEMVAGALAEAATRQADFGIDIEPAKNILTRLMAPTNTRARLFDASGKLVADTRLLLPEVQIDDEELLPPGPLAQIIRWLRDIHEWIISLPPMAQKYPPYTESAEQSATDYREVVSALQGAEGEAIRAATGDTLVVSVARPVQRFRRVVGAVMLSLETSQIEEVVRQERLALFEIFAIAVVVTGVLSLLLAGTIARPVRQLAEAADKVRRGDRSNPVRIPDLSHRRDEIGDLSYALNAMTTALYQRIDEIEVFAADVAHEIKNPLSSLRSAVETMARTKEPARQQKLMDIIKDDVGRLDRLISDISYASRIDAALSREVMEPVNVGNMLQTLVNMYNTTRMVRGVTIRIEVEGESRKLLARGLEARLGQVMRNLLDNALSFSPDGTCITVSTRRERGDVVIGVEDEGPGIPPDKMNAIFDRFYSERPREEAFGTHSGLGLSISKKIIDAHKGRIYAENRAGGGARFVVRLPAAS
jgi:two-component system sensor histidine kinase ChvG